MLTAELRFFVVASRPVQDLLGSRLSKAADVAIRALLLNRKTLEVAHQQVRFGSHELAFSSRVGSKGDLIITLDLGDPRFSERLVTENELRHAEQAARNSARVR